ncbi:DUF4160 domain-containing protein [Phyllobacterium calauticae]|jgi:Domain of unknown function (DUF4160)|nr:DUF4160 domain-containing protein [Phyllobacterium calauticae]MBZ3693982.1 DUF4160 domain-containing protein [Phyllobacterium calauticae]
MPTIARIGKILIRMFADDHNPPHFHVVTPDYQALIRISDFSTIGGWVPSSIRQTALQWASQNKERLEREWDRLRER